MALPIKHPDDVLDYEITWAAWLPEGDVIAESTWEVSAGIIEDEDKRSRTDTTVTIWLSGGADGQTYQVANTITTVQGRTKVRIFDLVVRDR